jgi:hypothetical protein
MKDAYHVSQSKTPNFFICLSSANFSNYVFEVQMTIIRGDCGGIIFRYGANNTLYYFEVCQNRTYQLRKYVDIHDADSTSFPTPSSDNSAIKGGLNQNNLIAIEAQGDIISLYVNNHQIASVQDNSYSKGQVGLFARAYNSSTEVVYNNAKVWIPSS